MFQTSSFVYSNSQMSYNCIGHKSKETTNIMRNIIVELYGHPVLFVITLLFILGFLGMTYEFILRLFGKPPSDLHSVILNAGKDKEDDEEEEDDDIVKVNDVDPDSEDEFEEKEEENEDEEKKDNYDNPFKRI